MNPIAELEIGLHRREAETVAVEFRFSLPESDAEIRIGQGIARFDSAALAQLSPGGAEYAQALTKSLFADPAVLSAFTQAYASAQSQGLDLRLRIFIGPSAPELHSVRWETLRDPERDAPLLTGENLIFSRYLSAEDWRPVRLRPKARLKALIVVANPSNLPE